MKRFFSLLLLLVMIVSIMARELFPTFAQTATITPSPTIEPTATVQPTATPEPQPDPNQQELDDKKRKVDELQNKLKEVEGQKISLSTTLQYINTKISLSQAEIDTTQSELGTLENDLADLTTRISGLDQSLDVLSQILVDRVNQSYKQKQTNPLHLLVLSKGITDFFTRYHYLQIAQDHTREIMQLAEEQKVNFDVQKEEKEKKQLEVEKKRVQLQSQQNVLAGERNDQQQLLNQTQNDERKYQEELSKTLAEIEAIQGIIAGKGDEVKVRDVKAGDAIASIIVGASPCSTGTHLHFEVVKVGVNNNPAGYLKSTDIAWSNDPDGPFGFSGDWDWPVNDAARITQGYGMTWYARVKRAYGGAPHTGIDMVSKTGSDNTVKAVRDGQLYRGGISCGGGTLRYVRVIHNDGLSTYYLHVNY